MNTRILVYNGRHYKHHIPWGYGDCWQNEYEFVFTNNKGKVELVIPKSTISQVYREKI